MTDRDTITADDLRTFLAHVTALQQALTGAECLNDVVSKLMANDVAIDLKGERDWWGFVCDTDNLMNWFFELLGEKFYPIELLAADCDGDAAEFERALRHAEDL
jgi:hypothetical protein